MIRMRINEKEDSTCQECGAKFKNTPEMYDIQICKTRFTLCKECLETISNKSLRMSVNYSSRLKSNKDITRQNNYNKLRYNTVDKSVSEAMNYVEK